jgi:hypothetical protein
VIAMPIHNDCLPSNHCSVNFPRDNDNPPQVIDTRHSAGMIVLIQEADSQRLPIASSAAFVRVVAPQQPMTMSVNRAGG